MIVTLVKIKGNSGKGNYTTHKNLTTRDHQIINSIIKPRYYPLKLVHTTS